jgi:hypothetical protein
VWSHIFPPPYTSTAWTRKALFIFIYFRFIKFH